MTISLAERMKRDARLCILECLADDPTYRLNHEILREMVDRQVAITLSDTQMRDHLAWLDDAGLIETETIAPFVMARLTGRGLACARGTDPVAGVSRPRPAGG